ncbi:TPA: CotH kinase family protein [Acinetobacter baumannii]
MPLPNILEFIGNSVTQAGFKTALEKLLIYLNVEGATKAELNAAVTPKADKTYVDNALSEFQVGATKFYATLAEANADIANIMPKLTTDTVKDLVNIGEVANGGTWYKASSSATSLTKSPYDSLKQSKDYTDQLFKKYFNVVTTDPEFLLVITDNAGNRLLAIDRSGYTHLNLTQEYTDTVKPSDTTYQSLVSLLSLLGNVTTDPENLFVVSDASKNTLLKIGRDGMISGNFNIGYSDLLNTPQAPLQLGLEDSSGVSNPYLFKISDYSGNILFAIFKDGTVDIPYLSSSNLQVDTINSVLSILEQNTTAKLTTKTKVNVTHQGYMRLKVEALNFPTDTTGQVGTKGTVLFCNPTETEQYLKCNVEMFVQGASSANDFKKGYTFDLYNSNGEELGVKFGDMISSSSFHLKAFYRDPTHTRDQAGYRFWKSLVETLDYPYCKINNSIYAQSTTRSDKAEFTFDAKYYPHGFPVEIYLNDTFHGLYTLRLKKTRENYALNNADLNHIFLDNAEYRARLNASFNYTQWEIKSPKMKGYSDQGPIPSAFPTVQAAIDSLFNFTKGLSANYANHATVLNLPHWVLFYILAELTGHWDIDGNNYNLFTWDGVHWSILPYDMDLTLNWYRNSGATQNGFLINVDIWQTFRTVYSNEIKAMWTKFRNEKSLTIEKVVNTYRTVAKDIPREVYVADKAKWGLATDFTGNDYPNIEQIYRYIAARIAYLDSQWLV